MRAVVVGLSLAGVVGVAMWLRIGEVAAPRRVVGVGGRRPPSIECRWERGQRFAFDVAIDTALTFDEASLVPGRPSGGDTARPEHATASGRLEAAVLSVNPGGMAILAARLPDWTTDATGGDAFPAIDADATRPYLLQVDGRCHVVATARPKDASVIAYRRVLGVLDHLDVVLPVPGSDAAKPYPSRQLGDLGWATFENRWVAGAGRGSIERRRLAYDVQPTSTDALPTQIRIRNAGGSVVLHDPFWFSELSDREDVDVVAGGRVPLRSRSTSRIARRPPDASALDVAAIAVGDFTWGRPSDDEVAAAHEALRGNRWAGLPAEQAVAEFLAQRDGGAPGAWHDAQRMLRDWMRGNPAGVRELARAMAAGRYARKDDADLVLAMAKSGSPAARDELHRLAGDASVGNDLRVQAASACGDLKQPTPETVATLTRLASQPRAGTPDDILPSTALMSLGTIVDAAPGSPAAAQAAAFVQRTIDGSDRDARVQALYAASNSGDRRFLPAAIANAGSDDADERAAAAHAMRKMVPSAATGEVMNALVHDDQNPEVVKQVAESRRQQIQTYGGQLTEQEIGLYATKLPSAPEGVRWELLRTLGEVARLQPQAQRILVEWYRNEPVKALKVLIGQYVPASALRS